MANPYFNKGWPIALDDMQGEGQRWWISPWISSAFPTNLMREGDNTLIRGEARDFVDNITSIESLTKLLSNGIKVKRHKSLHAKVLLRQTDNLTLSWLGSSNLTQAGKSEDNKGNIEAMAGPFVLPKTELDKIINVWNEAEDVNLETLEREIELYKAEMLERLLAQSEEVLVLRLMFKTGRASITLPDRWFEKEKPNSKDWEGVHISVPYIKSQHPILLVWDAYRIAIQNGLKRHLIEDVRGPLGQGLYVFEGHEREALQAFLETVKFNLAQALSSDQIKDIKQDCMNRFSTVFEVHAHARGLMEDPEDIKHQVEKRIGEFLDSSPITLNFGFFIPYLKLDDEIVEAISRLKMRPRYSLPLFGDNAYETIAEDAKETLERAALKYEVEIPYWTV